MSKIHRSIALALTATSLSVFCVAQNSGKVQKGFGVSVVQTQPEFPGGSDSLEQFIQRNLKYPNDALLSRIQGRTFVGFKVDQNGKVTDARILSGINQAIDDEALRMVNSMPAWQPGTIAGKPASIQYVLPIDFILPSPEHK